MHHFSEILTTRLAKSAHIENAVPMKAYMKNQFNFFGIPAPERRKISKELIRQHRYNDQSELAIVVKELWHLPHRECQYCALDLLLHYKRLWQEETIELIEFLIVTKSWWDTVDPLAYDCAGNYFKMFPQSSSTITWNWNRSKNIWLQRSSLLFQKSYKNKTDKNLLTDYIVNVASSKEFFIQKAIGWVLREYARTDAEWVRNFVAQHQLAPLSKREAMKHL